VPVFGNGKPYVYSLCFFSCFLRDQTAQKTVVEGRITLTLEEIVAIF